MSQHRKAPHLQGLEQTVRDDETVRYRAAIRKPGGGKMRGPWRTSPAEARGDYVDLLRRRDAGDYEKPAPAEIPTVAEAFDAWIRLAELGKATPKGKARTYAPKTVREYRNDFNCHLRANIGDIRIDQLKPGLLQDLADDMHVTLSGTRVRNVFASLSATYRHFARPTTSRDDILLNPVTAIELPAQVNRRMCIATPEEIVALAEVLDPECAGVFALAAMAGLRHAEIKALRPADLDLARDWISVHNGWDAVMGRKGPKSAAGDRAVPIFAPLKPHLERIITAAHTYALFPSPKFHGRPRELRVIVDRMRKTWTDLGMVGLPDLHSARHSFASHLIYAGYDPVTAAEWMGHEQPSMTLDWYAKSMRGKGITPTDVLAYLAPSPELAPRAAVLA